MKTKSHLRVVHPKRDLLSPKVRITIAYTAVVVMIICMFLMCNKPRSNEELFAISTVLFGSALVGLKILSEKNNQ